MLLAGNPRDGFGVPARPAEKSATDKVGLGLSPLLTQAAQNLTTTSVAIVAAQPSPPQAKTIAQEAQEAVQANLVPPTSACSYGNADECAASTNGVCSSDGNLEYLNGNWHVASIQSEAYPCTSTLTETSQQILQNWKVPAYVGPFSVDFLNNPNGQITNLTNPGQVGSGWGTWLATQYLVASANALQSKAQAGHAVNVIPFTPLLPLVVGQTQWLTATGQSIPTQYVTPSSANPPGTAGGGDGATILAMVQSALGNAPTGAVQTTVALPATMAGNILPQVGAFPFPNGVPAINASGGHALFPNKAWTQPDANGYLQTFVQYENDPNTYSYYSASVWLNALSPIFGTIGFYLPSQTLTPSLLSNYEALKNGPLPLAKFKNPITGANWALWITLPGPGAACATPSATCTSDPTTGALTTPMVPGEGLWNTAIDVPMGAQLQIGISPIPQETFWDEVLDALAWIPTEIGEALWTLAGWMSTFVCDLAGQTGMLAQVPKNNPAAMAAALGALAIANAAQCGGPPIDCTQPAYAVCSGPNPLSTCPPQCLTRPPITTPVVAATPWYLQWWVLAAAGLGLLVLLTGKKKPKGAEPESELDFELEGSPLGGMRSRRRPSRHTRHLVR